MASISRHPMAREIITQYGDILRVGSLRIAGELISWDVGANRLPEDRLADFIQALSAALERHPETKDLMLNAGQDGLIYWLCKSLSVNYALAEVLSLLKQKIGKVCSIESWNAQGNTKPVVYNIRVDSGPVLHVGITWAGSDNIVSCDPLTGEKCVEGNISRVETLFALPPPHGFKPEYCVEMDLCRRSLAPDFSFLTSRRADNRAGSQASCERIRMTTPLRRTLHLRSMQDLSIPDEEFDGDVAQEHMGILRPKSPPLVKSVRTSPSICGSSGESKILRCTSGDECSIASWSTSASSIRSPPGIVSRENFMTQQTSFESDDDDIPQENTSLVPQASTRPLSI